MLAADGSDQPVVTPPTNVDGLPIGLLRLAVGSLRERDIRPGIIGSVTLLEHLPEAHWSSMATEDVDMLLYLDRPSQVEEVCKAMLELGLERPPDRSGKWIVPSDNRRGVDILARTVPQGFAEPACLAEPFANVAYLDQFESAVITSAFFPSGNYPPVMIAGPLVTLLGKCLKVARYLTLEDWNTNDVRQHRAVRAVHDMVLVFDYNRTTFELGHFVSLRERAAEAGPVVLRSLQRSVVAMTDLFSARGYARGVLAGWGEGVPWSVSDTDNIAEAIAATARQYASFCGGART